MNRALLRQLRERGLILEILHTEPSGPIDMSDLQARMSFFGYHLLKEDLTMQVRYLEDRGYVKITKKFGGEITLVGITANGTDIVTGIKEDEGLFIPRDKALF